ncbi:DUF4251 domain-containing protein [Flavobacterium sp. ZS1P14]|uniref:DUF4251 domain-containing protein n=1 Tax=Flavobacterium sp. ZS1P14 TaxID=3401729 RepID=UPI003AB0C228
MKTKISILVLFLSLMVTASYAQEKSKKQLREERKIEKEKQIASLVDSKAFVFIGRTALGQGFRSIDLTTNSNYVEFKPDEITSEMPFFGRGYSGIAYGSRDGGMNFKGSPKEFTVEKGRKAYQIKATVKGETDVYTLFLSVSFGGSATLTINSNNRSPISYNGEIRPIEKKKVD